MNNKGFAITGIIYTLFILFLMILLSVLLGLSSFQRLMINSTKTLETSFEGKKLNGTKLEEIKTSGIATCSGKYIFTFVEDSITYKCSAYLNNGTELNIETITLSPSDCNNYNFINAELTEIYSFEEEC